MYINQRFISGLNSGSILLEIKLPREIFKSPAAMEIISTAFLQNGGVGPWYNRNWKGNLVTYFSLEIASIEGDVRFFVRTEKKFKDLITNNFYSQYPGVEIVEADDYVKKIYFDHRGKSVQLWGMGAKLSETHKLSRTVGRDKKVKDNDDKLKVPADFKMIKTYVDYGLDKDPKEEFKNDPLTPILEWLGSMRKGEHAWYQVIIQDVSRFDGEKFAKTYYNKDIDEYFTLKDIATDRINQIRKKGTKKISATEVVKNEFGYEETMKNPKYAMIIDPNDPEKKKKIPNNEPEFIPKKYADTFFDAAEKDAGYKYIDGQYKENELTQEEKDELEMINRKLSKPLFRAYIRVMYIAKGENANTGSNVQSILNSLRAFKGANGFVPSPASDPYDYSWQNSQKKRTPWRSEEMFEGYVEREAFYPHITERFSSPNAFLKYLLDDRGLDWWADIKLFDKSLGYRKIARLLYEAIMHPYTHPHPNIFTINAEELATLWHLPGQVATTPGIKRVDSLKSDAPSNLPR